MSDVTMEKMKRAFNWKTNGLLLEGMRKQVVGQAFTDAEQAEMINFVQQLRNMLYVYWTENFDLADTLDMVGSAVGKEHLTGKWDDTNESVKFLFTGIDRFSVEIEFDNQSKIVHVPYNDYHHEQYLKDATVVHALAREVGFGYTIKHIAGQNLWVGTVDSELVQDGEEFRHACGNEESVTGDTETSILSVVMQQLTTTLTEIKERLDNV